MGFGKAQSGTVVSGSSTAVSADGQVIGKQAAVQRARVVFTAAASWSGCLACAWMAG